MTDDERKEYRELYKELMVLQADYKDLSKRLTRWGKRFWNYYKKIESKINGK